MIFYLSRIFLTNISYLENLCNECFSKSNKKFLLHISNKNDLKNIFCFSNEKKEKNIIKLLTLLNKYENYKNNIKEYENYHMYIQKNKIEKIKNIIELTKLIEIKFKIEYQEDCFNLLKEIYDKKIKKIIYILGRAINNYYKKFKLNIYRKKIQVDSFISIYQKKELNDIFCTFNIQMNMLQKEVENIENLIIEEYNCFESLSHTEFYCEFVLWYSNVNILKEAVVNK